MTLRALREEAGLTQYALALRTGGKIQPATISQLERGAIRKPTYDTVVAIAKALRKSPATIDAAIKATPSAVAA